MMTDMRMINAVTVGEGDAVVAVADAADDVRGRQLVFGGDENIALIVVMARAKL